MTIKVEKIASLLLALFFAYGLKSTILDYATEPKVIGGIHLDQPIRQAIPWTPIYFPFVLSAVFGYWIWPTKSYPNLARKMVAGAGAGIRTAFATLFISALCAGLGEFYLAFPLLTTREILPALGSTLLGAFQLTAIMGLFFAITFVVLGVFFGCLIVVVTHVTAKCLPSPTPSAIG